MISSPNSSTPIVRASRVERTPDDAFRIFTAEMGAWWPLPTHGMFGAEAGGLAFVDGQLVEISTDGTESVWGEVLVWDPPQRLVFTWHPGESDSTASEVEVEFIADGSGTRVVLEHRGWEAFGEAAAARRRSYIGPGAWGHVLDHFADGAEPATGAADITELVAASARFFDEAFAGGFGQPPEGEWTAEQIIAHVTLNSSAMLAVCQGIVHGTDVSFENVVCQDQAVLDSWVKRHRDVGGLVIAGRRVSAQLNAGLGRLSPDQLRFEVPCHLRNNGETVLADSRRWGVIAIDIQAGMHLPAHTSQLAELRDLSQSE